MLVIGLPINTADACSSVWQVELTLDIYFVYIGQKTSVIFRELLTYILGCGERVTVLNALHL